MFIHFSIILIIFKNKSVEFNQKTYDSLFNNIENNLRELGFGDVSVNKKMKDYVNLFFSILEKIEKWDISNISEKKQTLGNLMNIKDDNDLFVLYFNKFSVFLTKNSLKIFTKDILDLKF